MKFPVKDKTFQTKINVLKLRYMISRYPQKNVQCMLAPCSFPLTWCWYNGFISNTRICRLYFERYDRMCMRVIFSDVRRSCFLSIAVWAGKSLWLNPQRWVQYEARGADGIRPGGALRSREACWEARSAAGVRCVTSRLITRAPFAGSIIKTCKRREDCVIGETCEHWDVCFCLGAVNVKNSDLRRQVLDSHCNLRC